MVLLAACREEKSLTILAGRVLGAVTLGASFRPSFERISFLSDSIRLYFSKTLFLVHSFSDSLLILLSPQFTLSVVTVPCKDVWSNRENTTNLYKNCFITIPQYEVIVFCCLPRFLYSSHLSRAYRVDQTH